MKILTATEYAKRIGVHPTTVRQMCKDGQIPERVEVYGTGKNRYYRIFVNDEQKPIDAQEVANMAILGALKAHRAALDSQIKNLEEVLS